MRAVRLNKIRLCSKRGKPYIPVLVVFALVLISRRLTKKHA